MEFLYKKPIVQLLIATIGALALLIGCGWFVLSRLADGLCSNEVVAEMPSPDGRFRVIAFERDCGATTGFTTQVSLLDEHTELPNDAGNVFSSDSNHGLAPSGPGEGPEIRLRWENPRSVVIERHEAARIFLQETSVDGVHFRYTTFAKDAEGGPPRESIR